MDMDGYKGLSLEGYRKFWKDKMTERKKQEHFERLNPLSRHANKSHKGTDEVKSFGYDRDKLFGSGAHYSTGHLKDF